MTAEFQTVLAADRVCECGCGRSVAHKRADALTFDASCRKRLQRQQADVKSSRLRWASTLALAMAIENAERMLRLGTVDRDTGEAIVSALARKRLRLLGARPCSCAPPLVLADCDGDAVCMWCGHAAGAITANVNGFDAMEAAMIANGRSRVMTEFRGLPVQRRPFRGPWRGDGSRRWSA